ncbi:MAG TPA: hypothetical protein VI028_08975 [Solirubrobacterales bacterium]
MKLKLILTTAIVGVALALPNASMGAPPPAPPTQDSVFSTESPALTPHFTVLALNATSGPSGENPDGEAHFILRLDQGPPLEIQGPVTCLEVRGNAATINIQPFPGNIITVQVLDDHPDLFDTSAIGRAPTDCSAALPSIFAGPLLQGDIKVTDAQPLPTTMGQCKDGGWKQFGFANQGLCVAFVNHQQ